MCEVIRSINLKQLSHATLEFYVGYESVVFRNKKSMKVVMKSSLSR